MAAMRKAIEAASAEDMGELPMAPPKRGAMPLEDEYSPDAEHKAAFLEMCEALRAGDDAAAWEAYQACKELG